MIVEADSMDRGSHTAQTSIGIILLIMLGALCILATRNNKQTSNMASFFNYLLTTSEFLGCGKRPTKLRNNLKISGRYRLIGI